MQVCSEDAVQRHTAMVQSALRKEVELEVDEVLFDKQARRLMDTNYVYHECATYRSDLVDALPPGRAVPPGLLATATFVPTRPDLEDNMRASGPAASTAAAELERNAAEEEESLDAAVHWLSVLDEDMDATMESSKLPVL